MLHPYQLPNMKSQSLPGTFVIEVNKIILEINYILDFLLLNSPCESDSHSDLMN